MTVIELINALKAFPEDATVKVWNAEYLDYFQLYGPVWLDEECNEVCIEDDLP